MSPTPRYFASLKARRALATFIALAGCGGDGAGDPTSTGSSSTSSGTDVGMSPGTAETAESGSGTGDVVKTHPCSREISFLTSTEDGVALVVGDVDGSGPLHVTALPRTHQFSWSPDGSRFVYRALTGSQWSGQSELFLGDLAGGSEPLGVLEGHFPEWAPVGDTIAFIRYPLIEGVASGMELWTVDAGTGAQTLLFRKEDASGTAFDWSPNADAIALTLKGLDGEGTGASSMLRVPVDGGEPEVLVKEEEGILALDFPAWAPDGATIAFAGRVETRLQGFTVPSAGGAAQRVTEGSGYDFEWSPDASALVYPGQPVPSNEVGLLMVVPGGGPEVELVPNLRCGRPRWCDTPDLIVATCRTDDINNFDHVIVVDAKDGTMREFAAPGLSDLQPRSDFQLRWRPAVL